MVFACKTATFGLELLVSMGPRLPLLIWECKRACLDPEWRLSIGPSLHLWFSTFKTATLASELLVSLGPSLHLWFCAFKTATLASELLVSMDASPHLCFLHAKERLLDVVLCIQNSVISTRITGLHWSQTSPFFSACKTATFGSEFQINRRSLGPIGPRLHLLIWEC